MTPTDPLVIMERVARYFRDHLGDRRSSAYQRGRRDAALDCARMANSLSAEWWADYKGRRADNPHRRADPHFQGMSDGAAEVANAISREFGLEES